MNLSRDGDLYKPVSNKPSDLIFKTKFPNLHFEYDFLIVLVRLIVNRNEEISIDIPPSVMLCIEQSVVAG